MEIKGDTDVFIAFANGQQEAVDYLESRNLVMLRDFSL